MAGTIRGKVDCYLNETSAVNMHQSLYKNTYDFFMTLVAAGVCTRVSRHTGRTTGTTPQQVGATDFYDGANPFLENGWVTFRFPSSGGRAYDFYIHVQWNGTTAFGTAPGNPGLSYGSTTARSLAFSAAIGVGGSPWAGTTNFLIGDPPSANDSKGASIWADPGGGLFPFPRSNAAGGTHATNRQNMVGMTSGGGSLNARQHLMADSDSFFTAVSFGDTGQYEWVYIGPYVPRTGIVPPYPLTMIAYNGTTFPATNTLLGTLTGNNTTNEGGIVASNGSQVRGMAIERMAGLVGIGRHANIATGRYDEWPITLYMNENPFTGLMGQVMFIEECAGLVSHDANSSPLLDRAVFGTNTVADPKIVAPWSATIGAPPRNNWTRAGLTF